MPKARPPYAAEFRQQMVDLVRSGRAPEDLAREFEPSAQAIRTWVAQAGRDAGERSDGLRFRTGACATRDMARPGSRGRPDPGDLPVHERESGSRLVSPRAGAWPLSSVGSTGRCRRARVAIHGRSRSMVRIHAELMSR